MSAGCARFEVEPKKALLRNREPHEARPFAADEKIAGEIGALAQQINRAPLAEHHLVGNCRHGQPPVPGTAMAMERGGCHTHGGERAFHDPMPSP